MSRICKICGKGIITGSNVSHAQNRSKRKYKPNIRKVKLNVEGKVQRVKICAQCLKSTKLVAKDS